MFETANRLEAALWIVVALVFLVRGLRRRGRERGVCFALAAAFLLFGLSDVVEARTGAWWRPWWLLTWKATCLATILVLLLAQIQRRAAVLILFTIVLGIASGLSMNRASLIGGKFGISDVSGDPMSAILKWMLISLTLAVASIGCLTAGVVVMARRKKPTA